MPKIIFASCVLLLAGCTVGDYPYNRMPHHDARDVYFQPKSAIMDSSTPVNAEPVPDILEAQLQPDHG